jgi:hypothetical protein
MEVASMAIEARLTTYDNPYSPFDDYDEWSAFDEREGYHSSSLLARVAIVGYEVSNADYLLLIEQAIDEIISENVSGMQRKGTREVKE